MAFVELDDHILDQVRQAADIVEIITQVTPLKQAGKSHKGLCPFHREKTPSFHVDRDKGLFYCFGCGTGGDVFKFLMLTERMTFPEAVEHIANRVGIALPKRRGGGSQRDRNKEELLQIVEDASEAYHQALSWKPNEADRYLTKRGIDEEVWRRYGLGYAPDSWDYVLSRLGRKHQLPLLEQAGLIRAREKSSGYYDRFRNRLMIPIHSDSGTIIGFGGRSLDGKDPKYLNSPESPLFNKSHLLYNLHRAKNDIRKLGRAILVEGYFDCIALDHAGIGGVVASMGTSLTPGQASLIRRFASRVVVCYDGDDAGRNASLRAAPVLLSAGLSVQICDVGDGEDPDTYIQKAGNDAFIELVGAAPGVFEFALGRAGNVDEMSGEDRRDVVESLVPLLSAVGDPILRVDALQRVADRLRLPFDAVQAAIRKPGAAARSDGAAPEPTPRESVSPAETRILRALIEGNAGPGLGTRLEPEMFRDDACRSIFTAIRTISPEGGPVEFSRLSALLRRDDEVTRLSELAFAEDDDTADRSLDQIVGLMERRRWEGKLRELQSAIQEAERSGDQDRLDTLYVEKNRLMRDAPGRA